MIGLNSFVNRTAISIDYTTGYKLVAYVSGNGYLQILKYGNGYLQILKYGNGYLQILKYAPIMESVTYRWLGCSVLVT